MLERGKFYKQPLPVIGICYFRKHCLNSDEIFIQDIILSKCKSSIPSKRIGRLKKYIKILFF